ncbi:MAG: hypothetical protein VKJ06_00615 [Vampirovibrionales bacterium]|nr:hypothetical protein [Vampirovibrionales bacterium]
MIQSLLFGQRSPAARNKPIKIGKEALSGSRANQLINLPPESVQFLLKQAESQKAEITRETLGNQIVSALQLFLNRQQTQKILSFRLNETLKEDLEQASDKAGRSFAEILTPILYKGLDNIPVNQTIRVPISLPKALVPELARITEIKQMASIRQLIHFALKHQQKTLENASVRMPNP